MSSTSKLPFLVSGQDRADAGLIETILPYDGSEMRFEARDKTGIKFEPANFAGLIILGDDSNNRATNPAAFKKERDWLELALRAKRPVLGICFGAQLMAAYPKKTRAACGLEDLPRCQKGICPVELSECGRTDPVMAPLLKYPRMTMYHRDYFQEPTGATALAWSAEAGVERHCEAFRIGPSADAVYGMQFHPEPTGTMLEDWFGKSLTAWDIAAAVITGRNILQAWIELALKV